MFSKHFYSSVFFSLFFLTVSTHCLDNSFSSRVLRMMYDYLLAQPRQHQVTVDVICFEIRQQHRLTPKVPRETLKGLFYISYFSTQLNLMHCERKNCNLAPVYNMISHETLESTFPPDVHWKAFKSVLKCPRENWLLGWLPLLLSKLLSNPRHFKVHWTFSSIAKAAFTYQVASFKLRKPQ